MSKNKKVVSASRDLIFDFKSIKKISADALRLEDAINDAVSSVALIDFTTKILKKFHEYNKTYCRL
jgi:hypothetical protein